ncbi:MAG: cyclase family protein [Thermomicrobiales bacterium]
MSSIPSHSDLLDELAGALNTGAIRVVDLTMPLGPETPILPLPDPWPDSPPFSISVIAEYDERGPAWYWNAFHTGEHTGTHFDAPVHWITGRDLPDNRVDTLPPARFVAAACVIDVSRQSAESPDFCLTPEDVERWEAEHGRIAAGVWVLLRTDWSRRSGDAYLNVSAGGPHTPGWTPECVRLLALDRDVLGVGVETVGTDAGQAGGFDPPFPAHNLMHGAGKLGLASLCNLDQLPPTGAIVIAAPLKIVNGSGSPVRVIALVGG